MTTTTENQNDQPSNFEFKFQPDGSTTLINGATTFEVADRNVTVIDAGGKGVQLKRPEHEAPMSTDIHPEDSDTRQIITTLGATVAAPQKTGPATVTTPGEVFIVDPNATASATAEGAAPETGLKLNITADGGLTGKLDGTEFSINGRNVAVDTDRLQVKPAAEASTDEKTDIHLSLSKKFNRAVVEGADFKLRIDVTDNVAVIYAKTYSVKRAESANIEANSGAVEANGDVLRLTLADGWVFDFNKATRELTAYLAPGGDLAPGGEVHNGSDLELAGVAPANAGYKITLSQDGTRVAMNGAGLETTGGLVATTDGVSKLTPFAALAALAAEDEAAKAAAAAKAYTGGWVDTGIESLTHPGKRILVATEDLPGTQIKAEAQQAADDTEASLPSVNDIDALRPWFNSAAAKGTPCAPLSTKAPGEYNTSDLSEPFGSYQRAKVFRPKNRTTGIGNSGKPVFTRPVMYKDM